MAMPVQKEYEQIGLVWAVWEKKRNDEVRSQIQIQNQFISKEV